MTRKLQFAGWVMALGLSAALVLPSFAQGPRGNGAQNRQANKPPAQPQRQPQRQERRQQPPPRAQNERQQQPPRAQKERQDAIQHRLAVLRNMPESARNQHLNDPNFTRGMSEEDKAMLHELSHVHVGGPPEPPGE